MLINLTHGEPVRFGADGAKGVVLDTGVARIVDVADVGVDALLVHDESVPDPSVAFALSRLANDRESPTPVGVFRAVERVDYGAALNAQLVSAQADSGGGDLHPLLHRLPTWAVRRPPGPSTPPG